MGSFWRRRSTVGLCIACVLLGGFYIFSRQVRAGVFYQIDFDTTVRLQGAMPQRLDSVWEDVSFLASPLSSIVLVSILTLLFLVDWKSKTIRLKAIAIPLAFALLVGLEVRGKTTVRHLAPPFFMIKHPTAHFPTYYVFEEFSYPSGHTARAVFLVGITGYVLHKLFWKSNRIAMTVSVVSSIVRELYRKQMIVFTKMIIFVCVSGILGGFALVVAIGQIYLGHHWLSDVVGGAIVGLGSLALVIAFLWNRLPK